MKLDYFVIINTFIEIMYIGIISERDRSISELMTTMYNFVEIN